MVLQAGVRTGPQETTPPPPQCPPAPSRAAVSWGLRVHTSQCSFLVSVGASPGECGYCLSISLLLLLVLHGGYGASCEGLLLPLGLDGPAGREWGWGFPGSPCRLSSRPSQEVVQTTDFPEGPNAKAPPPTIKTPIAKKKKRKKKKTPIAESLGGWPTCQVAMESGIPHLG